VPLALALGDDQVERLAQGVFRREAENAGRCRIPDGDRPRGIAHDDAIAEGIDQLMKIDVRLHASSFDAEKENGAP
jgi:hypothetical protein